MAKLQKKALKSILNITVPWKNISKLCKICFKNNQKCEELMKPEKKIRCHKDDAEDKGVKLVGKVEAAMHDFNNMDSDTTDISERVGMLRRIFDQVANHLNHHSRHEICCLQVQGP